jgi:Flp pilus assembly protein TadG
MRFLDDESGLAAVEAALAFPVIIVLMIGAADFGNQLHAQARLNAAVASGANYALMRAHEATEAGAANLATSLAALVRSNGGTAFATVSIDVNNGPRAAVAATGGAPTVTGGSANVMQCYCPTMSPSLAWGAAMSCGTACSGGGTAGRFVAITAKRPHASVLPGFGPVTATAIGATSMVQIG